ncbi:(2-(2,4-dihydroxy-6-methylphenyl)-2-oxoethyl)-4-hydroxy-2-pyrone synthase [Litoreibacter ascidiaceicola]|uniref:(2-(2,4-dihydroxy-6-methylphenyl)-2-oxoethyl)-4-hydroxy-2-pyrone synthase n=1 Tax=Litoreibacter ascidiaceicola TaxID=1486859 RepID=A0A1M4W4Y9_9RHOB|nr:3-oxoacyl-[acyl-carrier-protein] synthase III C-terminal domain-containing protein [Litoreibacter ascidiaceicola]SHE76286.1 (2-(2,4-dihydroxy-6-methylphenyl)-2-oxoethyl)-4-hydroxy-2-pyrone synthase [Litoreibacter ascidiaceicola]
MTVYLNGLGTAVPPHILPQTLAEDTARRLLGPRYSQFERLAPSFATSGVETRYSVVPIDWFTHDKGWRERSATYVEGATELFINAARAALDDAGLRADQVDTVVTVSTTGIATPTLEARAFTRMGFRRDIQRVPVFGLGCAGGVSGLGIAQQLAAASPGSNVLMVSVEACSVSFRTDRMQKADIIATVLFGDGAAAAVLSTDGQGPELGVARQILWPDTLDIMGWDVDEVGLGVIFDRSIPDFVTSNLREAALKALGLSGLSEKDITRFVCHPGGAKVVTAIEQALSLAPDSLTAERDVLRDFGNMSAPTVLFVLKQVLERNQSGQMMLAALGPGFTGAFLPLKIK